MRDLVFDLIQLTRRNRDGSFATQHDRRQMLTMFGEQLVEMGWKQMHAYDLKGRHVNRLLALWDKQGISPGTIQNRLSCLRWWAEKVGRSSVLANTNTPYGIAPRQRIPTASKAKTVSTDQLAKIDDPFVRMSLRLQAAFGLRKEECLKIKIFQADEGTHLVLQPSWTKGGRGRKIPIVTPAQRELIEEVKAFVKHKEASLIPAALLYIHQRRKYDYQTRKAGLSAMHGLRHSYAEDRFEVLAGFPCPHRGGPSVGEMTAEQQRADEDARLIISNELGHNRIEITRVYIG